MFTILQEEIDALLTFDPCKHQANSPESNYGIGKHEHLLYSSTTNCLRLVLSVGAAGFCGFQGGSAAVTQPKFLMSFQTNSRSPRSVRSRCCLYLAQCYSFLKLYETQAEVSWQLRPSSTKSDASQVGPHFHEVCCVVYSMIYCTTVHDTDT